MLPANPTERLWDKARAALRHLASFPPGHVAREIARVGGRTRLDSFIREAPGYLAFMRALHAAALKAGVVPNPY
jgi:hypothetical protein